MSTKEKSKKKETKPSVKVIVEEKLATALSDLKHLWSEKKFQSKIKKAAKYFSDGKEPKKKEVKVKKEKKVKLVAE